MKDGPYASSRRFIMKGTIARNLAFASSDGSESPFENRQELQALANQGKEAGPTDDPLIKS